MSPPDRKTAPLQIRGRPPSAKRFNKRVLALGLGGTALALLLAASFALRSPETGEAAPRELYNTVSKVLPDRVNDLPAGYDQVERVGESEPRRLGPPLPGDIGAGFYSEPKTVPTDNPFRYQPPPAYDYAPPPSYAVGQPPANTSTVPSPRTSQLFFIAKDGGGDGRQAEVSTTVGEAGFTDPALLALQTVFGDGGVVANSLDTMGRGVADTSAAQTAFTPAGTDIYNPHGLQMPASPYQVMAGTLIPASLVTGLNSDLPGQVIAQVTENVFDTPTGRHLLIPQGTRLLGRYDSDIEAGQSRALVVWTRIIRPDGSSLEIESLPGVDLSGQAGLRDRVDHHRSGLFGAALLSSVLSIASELGTDEEDAIAEAIRDGSQSTINQAGQKVVTRALSRKPTLRVRPGWRLRVIVNRDLILTPYTQGG